MDQPPGGREAAPQPARGAVALLFRRVGLGDAGPAVLHHGLHPDLAAVLRRIAPDEVHVNVPTRPPCEPWVTAPDEKVLERAESLLGESARRVTPGEGWFDLTGCGDVVDAILSVIKRHPMSEEELEHALGRWPREELETALARLAASGRAQLVRRGGKRFWCYAAARFRAP